MYIGIGLILGIAALWIIVFLIMTTNDSTVTRKQAKKAMENSDFTMMWGSTNQKK